MDHFFLKCNNVGYIQRLLLRSNGGGLGAAWHLARIEVTSAATGEKLVRACLTD